jgi:hypothetical protein
MVNTTLCIIGFGMSGILLSSLAKKHNINFIILEKEASFGGCWLTKSYRNITLQCTKYKYQFPNFPYKGSVGIYPSRDEILSYFKDYINRYKLENKVKYNSFVKNIEYIDETKIKVKYYNKKTNNVKSLYCNYLGICSGFYTTEKIPPNIDIVDPNIIIAHSNDFGYNGKYINYNLNNKKVIIIGNTSSACDFNYHLYKQLPKEITILYKSPKWFFPKFNKHIGYYVQSVLTSKILLKMNLLLPKVVIIFFLNIIFIIFYILNGYTKYYSFPKNIVTRNNVIFNSNFLKLINFKSNVNYIRIENITKISNKYIYYHNLDKKLKRDCDIIIFCTGYESTIPYMNLKSIPKCYKNIIFPKNNNIGLIGFTPSFEWIYISYLQSLWYIYYIKKNINKKLSKSKMNNWIETDSAFYIKHKLNNKDILYNFYNYKQDIIKDIQYFSNIK